MNKHVYMYLLSSTSSLITHTHIPPASLPLHLPSLPPLPPLSSSSSSPPSPCLPLIRSGTLHVGDQLLSINGHSMSGRTVQEARHLLAHSDIDVRLEIIPYHNFPEHPNFSHMEDSKERVNN